MDSRIGSRPGVCVSASNTMGAAREKPVSIAAANDSGLLVAREAAVQAREGPVR